MSFPAKAINLLVVETVFLALDYLVVGLRIWVRRTKAKPLEFNDYMIMLGLFFTTAVYVSELIGVIVGGGGHHLEEVLQTQGSSAVIVFGKISVAADILWNASVTSIKISILHLYTAIFPTPAVRRQAYYLIIISSVCGIAFILEEFLICRPLAYQWDKSIKGVCGDQALSFLIPGVINLVLDLLIISLPMPILWTLQMQTAKKVATSIVFGIGLVICLLCGIRLKFVLELDPNDPTWTVVNFGLFGAIEPLLGIISASLPILPPVFFKLKGDIASAKWQLFHARRGLSKDTRDRTWGESSSRTEHPDPHHFNRLEDNIFSPKERAYPERQFVALSAYDARTGRIKDPQNAIRVTTDWVVQSNSDLHAP